MPQPYFYNSLTKQTEAFRPKEIGRVRIYHCGPTVYKRQHIGNMRRYLFADFLARALRFLGYEVTDVMNITDVGHLTQDDIDAGEDKLEKEAKARRRTPAEIAAEQIEYFYQDLRELNIQPAGQYPRATEHIPQMIEIIQKLVERGRAYQTPTGIYFDVQSFADYGKLSGNTLDKLTAGARVDVREEKKHPADFALWKLNDPQQIQQWESPWGTGYPGWHIECSAMAGEWVDIHTGGEDNKFPHHENEIAQSESYYGHAFAGTWMHNRHLQMGGRKLAKREGEQVTLDTLKEKGFSPLAFRLLVFGSHYRSPMDFSWEGLAGAAKNLEAFRQLVRRLLEAGNLTQGKADEAVLARFGQALADDLNTPEALAAVMDFVHEANIKLPKQADNIWATLKKLDEVLGIFERLKEELAEEEAPAGIRRLMAAREEARKSGNFAEADRLREEIAQQGFILEDTPKGPRVKRK